MAKNEEVKEVKAEKENDSAYETLERTIKAFAKKNASEQRKSFFDYFNKLFNIYPELLLTQAVQCKIKFLLSLKFETFFSLDIKNDDYNSAHNRFYNFFRFLNTYDIVNKVENITNDEKRGIIQQFDGLLNALIIIFNKNQNVDTDIKKSTRRNLIEIKI